MALPAENWNVDYFISNESQCLSYLEDNIFLSSIPNLDIVSSDNLKHGQLVKFQGMIQDMHNPEIYYERYTVKNTVTEQIDVRSSKYMDVMHMSSEEELIESDNNKTHQRQSYVVISIPGLNDWTRKEMVNESKKLFFKDIFDKSIQTINSKKRDQQEMETDSLNSLNKKEKQNPDKEESNSEKIQKDNTNKLLLSTEHMLNFPIPNDKGKSCIVKLYDQDSETYKLNQVIEIIGFISLDPCLTLFHDSEQLYSDLEIQTHHPPASLIPRLHAIKVIIPKKYTIQQDPTLIYPLQSIRADLHKILTHLLFDDNLAADYLICHLISSIYKRNEYLCLGSFPLNFTNFPMTIEQSSTQTMDNKSEIQQNLFTKTLYLFISEVLPKSVYLECTLENLNDLSFVPKKDYECNRLTSGILQLSHNTHLVIDETKLTSGRVSENGKINYNALCDLIKNQTVNYDFKYYQMPYETDIPILILSDVSSFINGPVRVPIKSTKEVTETYSAVVSAISMHMNDQTLLNRIRHYLQTLKFSAFTISEDVSRVIQEDLVELKSSNTNITADDFHRCLVLSRLMALSNGLDHLTIDSWKQSLELEIERMNRIKTLAKTKQN